MMELDELWDWGDLPKTRSLFHERLLSCEDAEVRAQILTQVARTHGLEGDFETARARLMEAEALMVSGGVAQVRHALELGRVHNSSGDRAGAVEHFECALSRAKSHGEVPGLLVDALHMLGIATSGDVSLAWNVRALEVARSSSAPSAQRWLGSLFNNVAWTYFSREEYERALSLHEEGLRWREARGQTGAPVWIARWSVARMLRALGRVEEARSMQIAIAREREAADEPGGYVFEELGELALLSGESEQASVWFGRAWASLSQDAWMMEKEPERMARLKDLSGAFGSDG